MILASRKLAGALATTVLVAFLGCGDEKPPVEESNTKATVKGTVKIKGAPATGGEVVFDASNYKRKSEPLHIAPISKDGTYTVETLTGSNRVMLRGAEILKALPDAQFQKLSFDVQPGENKYDIELPAAAK